MNVYDPGVRVSSSRSSGDARHIAYIKNPVIAYSMTGHELGSTEGL